MNTSSFEIQINRNNFHQFKLVEKETPREGDLKEDQILIKIEKFAFTANNITYALVGDQMNYWDFFPVSEEWGIIPVWGFGDVIFSKNPAIPVGARYYGYYPMASHLILSPSRVKPAIFTDATKHRVSLPAAYNNYINTALDPGYKPEGEAIQCLFRPLFTTSFLIEGFIADNGFFGAQNILLTSASSKTGIGLAYLLSQRKKTRSINILGLTSEKNVSFVKNLGYYDSVIAYNQISQLEKEATVVVDFSGNEALHQSLNNHLTQHLFYTCLVGFADWSQINYEENVAEKSNFFFAPTQFLKRKEEWGTAALQQKIGKAWFSFTNQIGDWMTIKNTDGAQGFMDLYLSMLEGEIDPRVGNIVLLS